MTIPIPSDQPPRAVENGIRLTITPSAAATQKLCAATVGIDCVRVNIVSWPITR